MENLIKENEKRIEKFDVDFYLSNKKYSIAAALSALETTNEIPKSFFIKEQRKLEVSDYVMRLYALLQGLFVSIDSLYALALSLTKSKSFININNNKDLRQLKYIRNDVVGHPANRVLDNDEIAFCILDNDSISLDSFSYKIYTKDSIINKEVNINDILVSYYNETNALLDELYKLANKEKNKTVLQELISNTLDAFFKDENYINKFNKFILEYKELYPKSKKEQHRILWRFDLIERLNNINTKDENEALVIKHCVGLELVKIYELVYGSKYKVDLMTRIPDYISLFYRFLNKNKSLYPYLTYLEDTDHPLFLSSLAKLKDEALNKRIYEVVNYLNMIIRAYDSNDLELVYALALPIKEYKKK